MDIARATYLDRLHAELLQAVHGSKAALITRAAVELGVSEPTVHRWLAKSFAALRTAVKPRKRRSDAGARAVTDDELLNIAAALLASYRKSGQRIMSFDNAVAMLRDNGLLSTELTPGRLATILMERGLHPGQLTRPDPAIEQRSLHPNHVWQVDASVCVAYYLSNATGLQVMDERKFYKNKPGNLTRIQSERLIRYAVADHNSHQVLCRYYLGSECAAHLADFLCWCFAPKDGHVMHGVPFILQMDMGSANTSAPVLNMLTRLQVRTIVHERHNSRANGSVEKAHHLVEVGFESGLRFAHVDGLEDLNAKALTWANWFGATKVHSRYGDTRHARWMSITAEQLRLAPPIERMRELPTTHPILRRVSNNLTIDFAVRGHGTFDYDLRYLPGVMPGSRVQVVVNGLLAPAVQVEYTDTNSGEIAWMTIEPTSRGEDGVRMDAPVIGEHLRTAPSSVVDTNREKALQRAFGGDTGKDATNAQDKGALAFEGKVDPFKRAAQAKLPAYLPRRGTQLESEARRVESSRISTVQASKRIREALMRLGQGDLFGAHVHNWLHERFGPAGVPDDQIDALVAQFAQAPVAPPNTNTGLRAIQGGH